ncbi:flagellar biosynthesis anti-sigma factor FlgM [endosymbiont of unidentified scaly snail isolate Monju]|uniref:flagellar biosynthesis anti-sigma factor FlgM n=1 Tax=endosymbiont of unidentified scaly snail isolate Monju TaxID=1248727 RepID=UPI00038926C5|nr:flagellar biosynthesis anti-sigma factor FlgM [endosymbiont of unidentified scaly snail isolate Monju]BAN68559.1 negative regulator of flagellin synthesis FlgM [endosymbiont of unidentified scaly snail isolate Monju]
MSIEINGSNGRPPLGTTETMQSSGARNDSKESGVTGQARTVADTFQMTDRANRLQQLEQEIASQPVVDSQRVQDVQRALATGILEIDPARVADKLLRFEAGLGEQG